MPVMFQLKEAKNKLKSIRKVILIGSGKGGVGKSFVATGLALALSRAGHSTGLLDVDVHGSSLPKYLEVKGPIKGGKDGLEPKAVDGLKVMSVGFFTGDRPAPLKGGEKQALITQLFALTNWGEMEYLVVDLPPGTGDELLSSFRLFHGRCGLILVSTPSKRAIDIVSRLSKLAAQEGVPVKGVVLNMSHMTNGEKKLYPLGKISQKYLEKTLGTKVLAEIPLEPRVNTEEMRTLIEEGGEVKSAFDRVVDVILAQT